MGFHGLAVSFEKLRCLCMFAALGGVGAACRVRFFGIGQAMSPRRRARLIWNDMVERLEGPLDE